MVLLLTSMTEKLSSLLTAMEEQRIFLCIPVSGIEKYYPLILRMIPGLPYGRKRGMGMPVSV